MKAFRIRYPDIKKRSFVDLDYRYGLPDVRCHECGTTWGCAQYEYPAFRFDFLNENEFNSDCVVSVRQFEKIEQRFGRALGRHVLLVPGGSLGEPAGTAISTRLDDFAWGRIAYPQISKRARDLLADDGINLTTASVSIRCHGKKVDTHLALHVE